MDIITTDQELFEFLVVGEEMFLGRDGSVQ